ncbi:Isoquinoline 1-oxidoreductase subunit [Pyxidicoccus fallax]|uniref:Isoquinoline 1-oxidoreductase subunit n=1 Tax=Pyxidicoccus fallax TaxID=394095 RepID=A0A848LD22_9BACT|nr:Isoquinoline 1-oxidoreductase subunit [Pyxidicoccus fallax]NMO16587.1 Isoquinoline 1-oxidoreductase subunit [Pyxidicoccus fallax]NPC78368.1 Isoquinoline 1-oxidoreductase subunit [Pyxidicoccus fallax]
MQPSLQVMASLVVLLVVGGCRREPEAGTARKQALPQVADNALRAPKDFAVIEDTGERSKALFLEASRVLLHPRCANCHPSGDVPLHGMNGQPHDPPVVRGPGDKGVVGMECTSCHQDRNLAHARVPGAPNWHLAPIEMAWVGKSPAYICEQLKDPKRNGGKTLAQIVEHNAHDELVGWGWEPGHGREPAPGTQEQFGAIVAAWVETGARCPSEEDRP